MKKIFSGLLAALLLVLLGCSAEKPAAGSSAPSGASLSADGRYRKLTPQQAKERMDSGDPVIIVDVRTQAEFDEGHIPGAILLPNETIGSAMPAALPDPGAELLVYCRSGNRSRTAALKLLELGYTDVFDFGGIRDWPYETVR